MTYEEALKILDETVIRNLELKVVLSEAVEKQIPKKPINISLTAYKFSYDCPSCGANHKNEWCGTNRHLPFCSICGKSLDWSDTE